MNEDSPQAMRLDKWLWAARFYKTRSLAQAAIEGGKVHINGQRCKSSRQVQPGDRLQISREQAPLELDVLRLNAQRRPYAEACLLYRETEASLAARRAYEELKAMQGSPGDGAQRPDKHQRRELQRLRGKH